jgi:hypothetical protein
MYKNVGSNQTDYVLHAGVVGKKIRLTHFMLVIGGAATNVTFNSKGSGAGVAISPLFAFDARSGACAPYAPNGWLQTNEGEALTITTSNSGVSTGILFNIELVDF